MPRSDNQAKSSRFFAIATACLVVATLYFAQEVLVPLALGFLFTFLLSPLVIRLERMRVPRAVAVVVVVLLGLGLLFFLGWTVSRQAVDLAYSLPRYRDNIEKKISHLPFIRSGPLDEWKQTVSELTKNVRQPSTTAPSTAPTPTQAPTPTPAAAAAPASQPTIAQSIADTFANALRTGPPLPVAVQQQTPEGLGLLQSTVGTVAAPLGTAFIVVVFVIFMLLKREDLRDRLIRLVGQGRLDVTTQALNDAGERISRYLLMQSIVNTIYGVVIGTGLYLIGKLAPGGEGFPNAPLWGLLCGLLRFVPYVGPWLGAFCPVMLSFAVFPGVSPFVFTLSLFACVEIVNNSVLEPVMYGSSTGLSAIAILAAAVFWTWLWGPIGLLLSTPLTVCVVVIGKYVPALQFLDIILGDEQVLTPEIRLYQRLLALDEQEASDVLDEMHKTMPLDELYDSVVLPALAMAELDFHRGRLDAQRHESVRQSLRDLVDEYGDRERAAIVEAAAKEDKTKEQPLPRLPQDCPLNVLILPARGVADELVGVMLSQLLDIRGYCASAVSQNALASEMVDEVERKSAEIVVVSAVPPDAVVHARYLCKRLHARYPELAMAVGLWTVKGDLKRPIERIACSGSVKFGATLRGVVEEVHQLAQARIANRSPSKDASI